MRSGRDVSRLHAAETQADFLSRALREPTREAELRSIRAGHFKARLTQALLQSGVSTLATAKARLFYWDGTQFVYSRLTTSDAATQIVVCDYLLTGSGSLASGTHVRIHFDEIDCKWWVDSAGCGPSDWEPVDRDA